MVMPQTLYVLGVIRLPSPVGHKHEPPIYRSHSALASVATLTETATPAGGYARRPATERGATCSPVQATGLSLMLNGAGARGKLRVIATEFAPTLGSFRAVQSAACQN